MSSAGRSAAKRPAHSRCCERATALDGFDMTPSSTRGAAPEAPSAGAETEKTPIARVELIAPIAHAANARQAGARRLILV